MLPFDPIFEIVIAFSSCSKKLVIEKRGRNIRLETEYQLMHTVTHSWFQTALRKFDNQLNLNIHQNDLGAAFNLKV